MGDLNSIIIIDSDQKSIQKATELIKHYRNVVIKGVSTDIGSSYELIIEKKPGIVVLDMDLDPELKLAETIAQKFPDTVFIVTASAPHPDLVLKAMRTGAREFITKPFEASEFHTAFKNVLKFQSQRSPEKQKPAEIFTVFGVKGGVGATTIATNLAVNLAQYSNRSVILLDLNLQLGNSNLYLNLKPNYSITDVAYNLEEIKPETFKDSIAKHECGLSLLSGPYHIEDAVSFQSEQVKKLLGFLKSIFGYIVIDVNKVFDEFTIQAFDESKKILTVFTLDIPSLYNTRRCMNLFQKMGYGQDKAALIANRCDAGNELILEEFKNSIKDSIYWTIPNQNYATIINAINRGEPLTLNSPESKTSQSIRNLARNLGGDDFMLNSTHKDRGTLMTKLFPWR